MSKTRFISITSALSAATLLAPSLALGWDIGGVNLSITPRVEGGVMYYEYQQGAVSATIPSSTVGGVGGNFTQEGFKFTATMPTVSGGLTFNIDRFFIDLSGLGAFNGSSNANNVSGSSFGTTSFGDLFFYDSATKYKADFNRGEYAVSAGYGITDQLSAFAGYKWAKTDFTTTGNGLFNLQVPFLSIEGVVASKDDYDFKYNGPFVGLAYGLNVDQGFLKGNLGFNFAVAFLDGKVNINPNPPGFTATSVNGYPINIPLRDLRGVGITPQSPTFESKGSTTGLTFGITWRGYTSVEGLMYSIGVNGYNYQFNADKSNQPNINEALINFKLGISYAF